MDVSDVSANCLEVIPLVQFATVSFDCNFRSALWGWQEARDCITEYLPYVDVLFGIEPINFLRYLIAALPIEESGTTVKYEASIPRLESDAATLASAPPYVTLNSSVVRIFS